MTFSITHLANDRALVTGNDGADTKKAVLDASEYNYLVRRAEVEAAQGKFDAAVEAFHAPLTSAAEELEKARAEVLDPIAYFVEREAIEGAEAKPALVRHLSKDTVILKLIEAGRSDRLVWVGDTIEVTKYVAPVVEIVETEALVEIVEGIAAAANGQA